MDTADAWSVDGGDSDVAFLAPVGGPGVPDEEVVKTVLGTVADCKDGMVEGRATVWAVDDSALVLVEDWVVRFDKD